MLIVGGGAAAFELLGRLSPRRLAWASPGITLDPTKDPLDQGYESDGTGDYATGARLIINDTSNVNHRTFYATVPEIAVGSVAVDVTVRVLEGNVTLAGVDTGVRAILSEGAGGLEVAAALIERLGIDRRIALVTNGGGFSEGFAFDWSAEQVFRIERNADPARRAVLTVAGNPPEVLTDVDLPAARRLNPNFEFGCSLDPARAVALWGPIGLPVFPMTITPAHAVLIPNRIQGIALDGSFQLDPASDGFDPVTEGVALALSTPGGSFYPASDDVMPVGMRTIRGGWSITDAERARTGIEFFLILRTADPGALPLRLPGRPHSTLAAGDYSQVRLNPGIGDDQGSVDMNLVAGRRGNWFLP